MNMAIANIAYSFQNLACDMPPFLAFHQVILPNSVSGD